MLLQQLVPVLQLAVGPVIVISGVGLVLLSMTNRYGRVIDRAREISAAKRTAAGSERVHCQAQLGILVRRARLVRLAIAFASLSLLFAAVLIMTLFVMALFGLELALLLIALFMACMACLVVSLVVFLLDINISLAALEIEARHEGDGPPHGGVSAA